MGHFRFSTRIHGREVVLSSSYIAIGKPPPDVEVPFFLLFIGTYISCLTDSGEGVGGGTC